MTSTSRTLLLFFVVSLLCPSCIPTDDSSGSSQDSDAGRIPSPLADFGTADTSQRDTSTDWGEWGTLGSREGRAQSPDGYALCGLSDIRTDDLTGEYSTEVPDGTWSATPISDDFSRCGDDDETTLWRLTNCERISRNIEPLACDLRLVWVSRQHSADMIERDFWDHINPDGETPFDRMVDRGISFSWAGENIANYPDLEELHWGWMDSPDGHRENILLGDFTHVGIGAVQVGWGYMVTQDFIGI